MKKFTFVQWVVLGFIAICLVSTVCGGLSILLGGSDDESISGPAITEPIVIEDTVPPEPTPIIPTDTPEPTAIPPTETASEEATQTPQTSLVASVTDGDTVKMSDGEIIRIIGIDTPEMDQCGGVEARVILVSMIENRQVVLVRDEMTDDRDRYGRLLRYIEYEGTDVGLEMVKQGWADSYMYDSHSGYPYSRESEYHVVQDSVLSGQVILMCGAFRVTPTPKPILIPTATPWPTQLWTQPTSPAGGNCSPCYSVCIPPYPPDLDCGQISFCRFQVYSCDPHGFDGDGDGIGCESCN
jgi:endonuclease YncB( thermonuclease family)